MIKPWPFDPWLLEVTYIAIEFGSRFHSPSQKGHGLNHQGDGAWKRDVSNFGRLLTPRMPVTNEGFPDSLLKMWLSKRWLASWGGWTKDISKLHGSVSQTLDVWCISLRFTPVFLVNAQVFITLKTYFCPVSVKPCQFLHFSLRYTPTRRVLVAPLVFSFAPGEKRCGTLNMRVICGHPCKGRIFFVETPTAFTVGVSLYHGLGKL